MNKDRQINSELNSFLLKRRYKGDAGNHELMDHIKTDWRMMEFAKAENCKFTATQVFELIVLFPFLLHQEQLLFIAVHSY